MKIAQGKRVKRAPPWVTNPNESKPSRAKENVDKVLELLSSLRDSTYHGPRTHP
jgi:hypothetical protein